MHRSDEFNSNKYKGGHNMAPTVAVNRQIDQRSEKLSSVLSSGYMMLTITGNDRHPIISFSHLTVTVALSIFVTEILMT